MINDHLRNINSQLETENDHLKNEKTKIISRNSQLENELIKLRQCLSAATQNIPKVQYYTICGIVKKKQQQKEK